MKKIMRHINNYFIEMVEDEDARRALAKRLTQNIEDRHNVPMPVTKNVRDAFYVAFGCRFQDRPLLNLAISIGFIVVIGILVANFIVSFLG